MRELERDEIFLRRCGRTAEWRELLVAGAVVVTTPHRGEKPGPSHHDPRYAVLTGRATRPQVGRTLTSFAHLGGLVALVLSAAVLMASAAHAQDMRALRDEYVTEAQLLDADLDNYLEAREQEEEALRRLVDLGRQLDRAMGDASVPASELIRLHQTIDDMRGTAFDLSADAGRRREEMGDRMRRMQGVLQKLQREGVEYLDSNGEVGGTWLLESQDGLGLMSLEQRGGQASGSYRLSNGRHGRVRGSFRGRKLRVELEDSAFGPVGSLEGHLDDRGELSGQWSARELAAGRPTGGTWSGRRLSFEELLSLEP